MNAPERITAVGVFADRSHAEYVVEELKRHGFRDEQIGFLVPDAATEIEPPPPLPGTNMSTGGEGLKSAA